MNKKTDIKEDKLKPLRPTLRQKKRFVKIIINSDKKFSFEELSNNFQDELIKYIGLIDYSNHGVWFVKEKFDYDKQVLVIKVSTKLKDKLVAALRLVKSMKSYNLKIEIVRVASTLKGLEKEK